MHIDGLGAVSITYVPTPVAPPAGSASFTAAQTAAAQALEEEEKKGGGGGGGHSSARKAALESIDDIAARASLNIEHRRRTTLDRMRDIELLKAELAGEDEHVGEKEPDERERGEREDQPAE